MVRPVTSVASVCVLVFSACLFTTGSAEDAEIRIKMEAERVRKVDPSADIVIGDVVTVFISLLFLGCGRLTGAAVVWSLFFSFKCALFISCQIWVQTILQYV